jgi:hypothetical protein
MKSEMNNFRLLFRIFLGWDLVLVPRLERLRELLTEVARINLGWDLVLVPRLIIESHLKPTMRRVCLESGYHFFGLQKLSLKRSMHRICFRIRIVYIALANYNLNYILQWLITISIIGIRLKITCIVVAAEYIHSI